MRVQLTFRSGAQVVIDVERLQVTHDGPGGRISRIKWDDTTIGNRLLGLVPADVVAVVELDAQPPPPPHTYSHGPNWPTEEHPSHPGTTCERYHDEHHGAAERG